ncbi:uncharacterized protein LOC131063643 isoform X2 [Cryptomeria japonica]|nr:uncharacterized protein LOC131063643 isoform X2 [Cryptomeria japonica]XP_057853524.2 uncharacterized protein LOC131063643 isoform X2 [Cryptomeria japonica]XP_057853525.2 uncharacterized protein LOC131063643 isoform X2 [Cryptomeria japonica]
MEATGSSEGGDLISVLNYNNEDLEIHTDRTDRLSVKIVQMKDLKKQVKCVFLKLKVGGFSRRSNLIKNTGEQDGALKVNQDFSFEVIDPQSDVLSIQVYCKGVFGLVDCIGTCKELPVENILKHTDGDNKVLEAQWYDLYSKDGRKKRSGQILMHVIVGAKEVEQRMRAFVGTWNVGNSQPPLDLSAWLPTDARYEIVAIGTQESDYQPRAPFTECGKDWLETCKNNVGSQYRIVHYASRGQMRLVVFVRDDVEKAVSDVDNGSEATGVGHVIANKGGVCISFKFWDTGLCFVNSHFAAHDGQCEARNGNYREIVRELRVGFQSMDLLNQFHHVFWMGDLNYRLDFTKIQENPMTPERHFWHAQVKQILDGNFKQLLQYDELLREKSASRVLHGFMEGDIKFPPTFKMQKESSNLYCHKRMPAWCDRVLWRTLEGCDAKILTYTHCPTILTSDHKPVSATFALTTHSLPPSIFGNTTDDNTRWHIRFASLRASNLRASDVNGSSDPYILFTGRNLIQDFKSKVKHQTLNPEWNMHKDLPIIVLSTFSLQRLEKEYLMIQVLDYDYASANDSLGFTTIHLAPVVSAYTSGLCEPTLFKVEILHNGLPAGTLEGSMKLSWEKNSIRRKSGITRSIISRTQSLQESFKKRVPAK